MPDSPEPPMTQEQACQAFIEQVTMPLLADPGNDAWSVLFAHLWGAIYITLKADSPPEMVKQFRDAADAIESGLVIRYEGGLN